jgi:hypothetical protein
MATLTDFDDKWTLRLFLILADAVSQNDTRTLQNELEMHLAEVKQYNIKMGF